MIKSGWFDTAAFYGALDAQRIGKAMTWRQIAAGSGVSASTLTRMAQGKRPDVDGLAALCAWSGLNANDYVRETNGKKGTPESLAMISTYLKADPHLTAEGAEMLDQVIKATYEKFRRK